MNMAQYRKNLQRRMVLYGLIGLLPGVMVATERWWAALLTPDEAVHGFTEGLAAGFALVALMMVYKYGRIIRDEKALKHHYCWEHDERRQAAAARAGLPMLLITSCLMLLAAIAAGYYSRVIFATLVAAAMAQLLVSAVVKLICLKTM